MASYKLVGKVNRMRFECKAHGVVNNLYSWQIPDSLSFEDASTLPSGVGTAAFPLYNPHESATSFKLTPPWAEGGRGKYAGKPIFVVGGAGSMGQFGLYHPVCAVTLSVFDALPDSDPIRSPLWFLSDHHDCIPA